MRQRVVGFWGYAQSGKDTACHQLSWPRAAMADELKADLAPLVAKMGFDPIADKDKVRELWVAYGRLGRQKSTRYWIDRLRRPDADHCITDLRYLSEIEQVRREGGLVIEIIRPGYGPANDEERKSFQEVYEAMRAGSLDVIPRVFNSSTPEALGAQVDRVIQEFFCGF